MNKIILLFIFHWIVSFAYSIDKRGISVLMTENKVVYDICFSAKGDILGIADNSEIKIYRTNSKELLRQFKGGHNGQILSLDISQDSTILVSGGKDSTIVIRDFINGNIIKSLRYHKGIVTSVKLSPDGRYLVSGGTDDKVYLYDIKNDIVVREFTEHKDDVTCVAFSPDSRLIAAGGGDKVITVYNTEDSEFMIALSGHTGWVRDVVFSHDGKRLLSCGDDAKILQWDVTDKNTINKISEIKYDHSWILCVKTSEDDKSYLYGSLNGSIQVLFSGGNYFGNVHVPVNRILTRQDAGSNLQIAIATRGKGVMLIDASVLKYR